jgi:hypothetical protein
MNRGSECWSLLGRKDDETEIPYMEFIAIMYYSQYRWTNDRESAISEAILP